MKTVDVHAGLGSGISDYALKPQIDTAAREKDTQEEIDAALEREIEAAYDRFNAATTIAEQRAAWERLKALIQRRSPQQCERMEAKLPKKWGTDATKPSNK
jgi:hypothetical protein